MNLELDVPLHPDLVHTPQIVGFVQLYLIGPQIPPPVTQLEILLGFQQLRANTRLQGADEFLNNM